MMLMPLLGKLVGCWIGPLICGNNRVGCERLLPRDNLKWALIRGFTSLQVVGELGHVQQLRPVSLRRTHIEPQVDLQKFIHSFGFPVRLWMNTRRKIQARSHELE